MWSDLSLPSASDILRYAERVKYMAERVRYMVLPINLRYIYKRVPPLVRSCLLITQINCLKGQKSLTLGLLFNVKNQKWLSE